MPFKSDKQRAYLWSQKPEVAKQIAYKQSGGPLSPGFEGPSRAAIEMARQDMDPNYRTKTEGMSVVDFLPVAGGIKALSEAETPMDYGMAMLATAPGGALLGRGLKPVLGATADLGKRILPKNYAGHTVHHAKAFHPDWDPNDPMVKKAIQQLTADTADIHKAGGKGHVGGVTSRGTGTHDFPRRGQGEVVMEEFAVDPAQWEAQFPGLPAPVGKPALQLIKEGNKYSPYSVVTDRPGGYQVFNPMRGQMQHRNAKSGFGNANRVTAETALRKGRDVDTSGGVRHGSAQAYKPKTGPMAGRRRGSTDVKPQQGGALAALMGAGKAPHAKPKKPKGTKNPNTSKTGFDERGNRLTEKEVAAREWATKLIANGASPAEIAKKTGLSKKAIARMKGG